MFWFLYKKKVSLQFFLALVGAGAETLQRSELESERLQMVSVRNTDRR